MADALGSILEERFSRVDQNAQSCCVLFVRHAEGVHNVNLLAKAGFQHVDPHLTPAGVEQARLLGKRWFSCRGVGFWDDFDEFHVSPHRRTLQTFGHALEGFVEAMADSGTMSSCQAREILVDILSRKQLSVMLQLREIVITASASLSNSTLESSLSEIPLLHRLVKASASRDLSRFLHDLHYLGQEEETVRQEVASATEAMRTPLRYFESSGLRHGISPESVGHAVLRSCRYSMLVKARNARVLAVSHGNLWKTLIATQWTLQTDTLPIESNVAERLHAAKLAAHAIGVLGKGTIDIVPEHESAILHNTDMAVICNVQSPTLDETRSSAGLPSLFVAKLPARDAAVQVELRELPVPEKTWRPALARVGVQVLNVLTRPFR